MEELPDTEGEVGRPSSAPSTEVDAVENTKQDDSPACETANEDNKVKARLKGSKSSNVKSKDNSNTQIPLLPDTSSLKPSNDAPQETVQETSSNILGSNILPDPVRVSSVRPLANNKGKPDRQPKPRKKLEATSCRTKARYKARLAHASIKNSKNNAGPVSKSVADLQINSPAVNAVSHESDDTDSISDLIIDIP